jgi:hypothetical protein
MPKSKQATVHPFPFSAHQLAAAAAAAVHQSFPVTFI